MLSCYEKKRNHEKLKLVYVYMRSVFLKSNKQKPKTAEVVLWSSVHTCQAENFVQVSVLKAAIMWCHYGILSVVIYVTKSRR